MTDEILNQITTTINKYKSQFTNKPLNNLSLYLKCTDEFLTVDYKKEALEILYGKIFRYYMANDSDKNLYLRLREEYALYFRDLTKLLILKKYDLLLEKLNDLEIVLDQCFKLVYFCKPSQTRMCYSEFEYDLCDILYPNDSSINLRFDYLSFFIVKARTLMLMKRYDEAEEILKQAKEINPVDTQIDFMKLEIDSENHNWIAYEMDLDRMYDHLYNSKSFLQYYIYLTKYYAEYLKDLKTASILNKYFTIKDKDKTFSQLIKKISKNDFKYLLKKGINLSVAPVIASAIITKIDDYNNEGNMKMVDYLKNLWDNLSIGK